MLSKALAFWLSSFCVLAFVCRNVLYLNSLLCDCQELFYNLFCYPCSYISGLPTLRESCCFATAKLIICLYKPDVKHFLNKSLFSFLDYVWLDISALFLLLAIWTCINSYTFLHLAVWTYINPLHFIALSRLNIYTSLFFWVFPYTTSRHVDNKCSLLYIRTSSIF